MDKEKATRILAKELGDKLGREAVTEDFYKDNLIKNASVVYQISSPFLLDICNTGEYIETILGKKSGFAEANYIFLKNVQLENEGYSCNQLSRFAVTPYALIGKKEETALRKLFYKNVQPEIAYAMSTLGIDNFIEFYKNYKESSLIYPAAPIVTKVLKEDLEVMEKFIDFVTKLKYDKVEEVDAENVFKQFNGVGSLNARLERLGVSTLEPARPQSVYVHRKVISQTVKQLLDLKSIKTIKKYDNPLLNEFIDFVFFSLPYEEQNVESNKNIMKSSSNPDFVAAVLSKEYSDGKYFQEYFEVINKEIQHKMVDSLKSLPNRKPVYDSFIWSKGFKDIELDYLNFYKENASIFIEYFSQRGTDEKKVILQDIMNCDFVNEEVANWLSQNEVELLREVGFNG